MSFEPKQKVELDPPKDDPISQQYLSKCDGSCSISGRLCRTKCLNFWIGSNPDYPTYVAIKVWILEAETDEILTKSKGTVFDVSNNKMYGPDGSYKGIKIHLIDVFHDGANVRAMLSVRRQRCIKGARTVISKARRLQSRLARSVRRAQESAQRLVHVLQQALQHQRKGGGRNKYMITVLWSHCT